MKYSRGNYQSLSTPLPVRGADRKNAYIVGSGLSGLAAACFLVRDGRMPGERIHILEKSALPGGACDGYAFDAGYVSRGERELDEHCECMWELLRSIPAASGKESVLDEIYRVNQTDPNYTLCRMTAERGADDSPAAAFGLTDKGFRQIVRLFMSPDDKLYGKKISDVLDAEVLSSRFFRLWRTRYFFENWHGAIEMKRYLRRFCGQMDSLTDHKEILFTASSEYESIVKPMISYLTEAGVSFEFGTAVTDVAFDCATSRKHATRIDFIRDGEEESIDLTEDDLIFITNGGLVDNTGMGSHDEPAPFHPDVRPDGSWELWRRIAAQDPSFGHPDVFCESAEQTCRMTATITTVGRDIIPYIKKICRRDPFTGRVVTGGPVTVSDSSWLMSWSIARQPRYEGQPKGSAVVWISAPVSDKPGDYVGKIMRECSGRAICEEWLYHIGVPESKIADMAAGSAVCVPVMMPFASAALMPRSVGDRPVVVPEGSRNFAFIGQFAETEREAACTTEYAFRTAMEAVYRLLDIRRGIPESCPDAFDVRRLLDAALSLRDGRPLKELKLGIRERLALRCVRRRIRGTDLYRVLKENQII